MFVCCECCVLSGRGLCDGLITRPEESYRLWCVVVCNLEKNKILVYSYWFLGAFAILCSAAITFLMSVRLSVPVHAEQFGSNWTKFYEILCFSIFRKVVERIQVSLNSHTNNKHFTRR